MEVIRAASVSVMFTPNKQCANQSPSHWVPSASTQPAASALSKRRHCLSMTL